MVAWAAAPVIAAGSVSSFAIDSNGHLYAWGDDSFGQLGIGRLTQSLSPLKVGAGYKTGGPLPGQAVATGRSHTVALKADGTLWAWGSNWMGQLGDGTTATRDRPVMIDSGFIAVAAAADHTLALKADGTLWGWGRNNSGQLGVGGDNKGMYESIPTPQLIGAGFSAIATGDSHAVALKADGSLWAWGGNDDGQVGDGGSSSELCNKMQFGGGSTCRTSPIQIGTGFVAIAAGGSHALAVKADGTLWAWGGNDSGQLGDSTTEKRTTPKQVGSGYRSVAAGSAHSVALGADGSLWTWGSNAKGVLGSSSMANESCGSFMNYYSCRKSPAQIGSGFNWIAASGIQSAAMKIDATLWVWGWNFAGQLGDGTTTDRTSPVSIGSGFSVASLNDDHAVAIKQDGSLWTWGDNSSGQLGDGAAIYQPLPRQVGGDYSMVVAGGSHTVALTKDGGLWSWGSNWVGQLGNGTTTNQAAPVKIGSGYSSVAVGLTNTFAIKTDGSLWAWGNNQYGQLGDGKSNHELCGSTSCSTSPVQIGSEFHAVSAGLNHAAALKNDGTLWTWGLDLRGQLGDDKTSPDRCPFEFSSVPCRSTPLQIGSGYSAIASGDNHVLALKTDGSLWAWGDNSAGQLGDGTTSARSVPTRIGDGYRAIAASNFYQFSLALKTDGTLWAWGNNYFGQLGDGSKNSQSVPVRIASDIQAIAAGSAYAMALSMDGTLWTWGRNDSGQLGSGLYAESLRPQLVVNDTLDGFLDLDPLTPNEIPVAAIPLFLVKADKSGDLSALSLNVDVRGLLGTYATRTIRAGGYNLYVAALAGSSNNLDWYQLDINRNWSRLAWPMGQFMTGVSLSSKTDSVIVEILDGVNVSSLVGSKIYVGYGTDAEEMKSAGRYREVITITAPLQ